MQEFEGLESRDPEPWYELSPFPSPFPITSPNSNFRAMNRYFEMVDTMLADPEFDAQAREIQSHL